MRTRFEELHMQQHFAEEVLIVLGGHASGLRVPVLEMTGKISIDPTGVGNDDKYEIRRIKTQNGPMRALVATTITDAEAADRYLALSQQPLAASRHA